MSGFVSEGIIGRSVGFILMRGVAERWAKNGVVPIIMWIK